MNRRCEACYVPLRVHETITCDLCAAELIESLLSSQDWLKVRGPFLEDDLRRELAWLKGRSR